VQVDPIKPQLKPQLKPPVSKTLKLNYDKLLSNIALKFNLRRYNLGVTGTVNTIGGYRGYAQVDVSFQQHPHGGGGGRGGRQGAASSLGPWEDAGGANGWGWGGGFAAPSALQHGAWRSESADLDWGEESSGGGGDGNRAGPDGSVAGVAAFGSPSPDGLRIPSGTSTAGRLNALSPMATSPGSLGSPASLASLGSPRGVDEEKAAPRRHLPSLARAQTRA
jgi:hypothetical protein